MAKVVNCPCGVAMQADSDDELVDLVQKHGKEVHSQEVSREDALGDGTARRIALRSFK